MGRAELGRHQNTLISDILELLMVARKLAFDLRSQSRPSRGWGHRFNRCHAHHLLNDLEKMASVFRKKPCKKTDGTAGFQSNLARDFRQD
jgi:hypothetical protein